LTDVVLKNRNEPAERIIEIIFNEVKSFIGSTSQMDDMTLVVIQREA
jgi:serine phosphatase RsbU (regulator of sigma subunit)